MPSQQLDLGGGPQPTRPRVFRQYLAQRFAGLALLALAAWWISARVESGTLITLAIAANAVFGVWLLIEDYILRGRGTPAVGQRFVGVLVTLSSALLGLWSLGVRTVPPQLVFVLMILSCAVFLIRGVRQPPRGGDPRTK
jgi:hypothetical protein